MESTYQFLVHHFLEDSARKTPEKTALICDGRRWSYHEIDQGARQLAKALLTWGLKKQDRVIIFLDNSAEAVIALFGVLKAGGIFVILNSSMKANKLRYILRDAEASFLITHLDKIEVVKEAIQGMPFPGTLIWLGRGQLPQIISRKSFFWDSIWEVEERDLKRFRVIDIDLATLIYTSGSTGEPKGVMSTHGNMVAATNSIAHYLEIKPDEVILDLLPLSFDYGLYQLLMAFKKGATIILEKSFLYPVKILENMEREKVTGFPVVPTVISILLGLKNLEKYDLRSLRYITNTGAALPVDHIRRLRVLFPWVKIFSMYGLTECKRVSYLPPEELDRKPGSVGKAIPNCEVFILDEEGKEVGPGEVGELVVRGANVMQGYWKAPELTEKVFRPGRYPGERFLYSGDLFKKDEEGYLYFVGRRDDLIKSRGERVSPREVENVLCSMPGIIEAAVIGVPDEILGQAIKAFVVCEPSNSISVKEIMKYCADNLEIFMRPKYVEILPQLPRTPNGKVDKKALRNSTS
ncbi:MAG: class I adenylate-forming enzyme family protein [Thermodesulfobacteriota bacterium]